MEKDWEVDVWTADMYKRHYGDFLQIKKEYEEIAEICDARVVAMWRWLEMKGAVKVVWYEMEGKKNFEPHIRRNYELYTNMFDKFSQWMAMQEKKNSNLPTQKEVREERMKKFHEISKWYQVWDFTKIPQQESIKIPEKPLDELDAFVQEATAKF